MTFEKSNISGDANEELNGKYITTPMISSPAKITRSIQGTLYPKNSSDPLQDSELESVLIILEGIGHIDIEDTRETLEKNDRFVISSGQKYTLTNTHAEKSLLFIINYVEK